MNPDPRQLIRSTAGRIRDPAGRTLNVIEDKQAFRIAHECGLKVYDVYREAMEMGICPNRYIRNAETISLEEQLRLLRSRVAVVGAGGLGGHVVLLLARLGIGGLVVVDHDVFDETNLNRQALSHVAALGELKCEEAVKLVKSVNPGVNVTPRRVRLEPSRATEILADSDVAVDALDNIADRFVLEEACGKLAVPLVHGALAGFEGQVMTIFPDDPGLKHLYGGKSAASDRARRPESVLGVPTPTPALIATLQVMEVIKILLKRGKVFRNAMLHVDMETGEMNEFTFK